MSKVLVLGDVMLDQYISGEVNRISPEAPVPILDFKNKKSVLGGAGNVIHNLINLGSEPSLATIIGDDLEGALIIELLKNLKINNDLIFSSKNISTTKKTRFITEGTQLLRLDNDSKGVACAGAESFKIKILENIKFFDCVIISDYNKGFCTKSFIQNIINEANKKKITILIDPKGSSWKKYMNATGLTPNKKEVEEQLNRELKSDSDFEKAARIIKEKFKLKLCLITRGSKGMTYYEKDRVIHQTVGKKEVFDVSGAGDAVIASLGASFCAGLKLNQSLDLSSFISSEVVTHAGTTPFDSKMVKKNE